MDCLLGSKVMKGYIDVHWVSVNHISGCVRALYLLRYGVLDYPLLPQ